MKKRALSLLMSLVMLVSMLPTTAWAAEEETVTVNFEFDCRSIATDEMMKNSNIEVPTSQTVTVPKGSKIYDALQKITAYDVTYSYDDTMVGGFAGIGDIGTLCEKFGVDYDPVFKYAGWMYSGNHVSGQGIKSDTLTENDTITFRYTVYCGQKSEKEWANFDWEFIDAYYGIQEDITAAKKLEQSGYTDEEWEVLQTAITNAETVQKAVEDEDKSGNLAGGLMLNYIAEKNTALWGPNSPTDRLQAARKNLERAVNRIPTPTGITVPSGMTAIQMGTTYQLNADVVPANASQSVIYEKSAGPEYFDISDTGLITPKAMNGFCSVDVKSAEDPTVHQLFMFKITEAPAYLVRMNSLLTNIAAGYVNTNDPWAIMEMGAYATAFPNKEKLNDSARQEYINLAINQMVTKKVGTSEIGDTAYDKIILALTAIGVDATELYPVDSDTAINALTELNGVAHSTSTWSAPFTIDAYNQLGQKDCTQARDLVTSLIRKQQADGSWNEFGTIDTTANVISALSFYRDEQAVSDVIDKAINYLSNAQKDDGTFDDGQTGVYAAGRNTNSTAMAIVGLCAVGVDPHTDLRFIKNGKSALDGLLSFALTDNSAFGHKDNNSENGYATEQAFRALIAASQVMATEKAYNIYDFSKQAVTPATATTWASGSIVDFKVIPENADVVLKKGATTISYAAGRDGYYDLPAGDYTYTVSKDGYVTKTGSFTITAEQVAGHEKQTIHVSLVSAGSGSGSGSGSKTVNVNVKVMVPPADQSKRYTYKHDSRSYTNLLTTTGKVTVTAGSSVRDAFVTALDRDQIGYTEQSNGYFPTIGSWSEFERGEKSGWMYLVNGSMPSVAAQDYELTGNATVVWFYTDDYSNDYGSESWDDDSSSSGTTTTPTTPTTPANPVPDKAMSFTDVKSNDWYYSSVRYAYDNGLFSGVSHDSFGPGDSMDRSMLATVLYSLDGKPAAGKSGFADVADGAWYADAVAWAAEHGIVSGVGGGAFTPGGTITREQLAVMLYRYAQYKGYDVSKTADLSGYADQDKLSDWAARAVQWACGSGLMNGRSAAQLAPEGTLTRAEAATMLKAFCENVKK